MTRGAVLITRPLAAIDDTARSVGMRGWEALAAPLTSIRFLPAEFPELPSFDALIFTSAQGVAAATALGAGVHSMLPVYAVGPATAAAARAAGFAAVHQGPGTAQGLEAMLAADEALAGRKLLHLSGEPAAHIFHLPQAEVRRLVVYEAVAATELPPSCVDYLEKGKIEIALFYSPRAGAIFSGLLEKCGLADAVSSIKALCLADSVVESVRGLPWQEIHCAPSPDGAGMMAALDDLAASHTVFRHS